MESADVHQRSSAELPVDVPNSCGHVSENSVRRTRNKCYAYGSESVYELHVSDKCLHDFWLSFGSVDLGRDLGGPSGGTGLAKHHGNQFHKSAYTVVSTFFSKW